MNRHSLLAAAASIAVAAVLTAASPMAQASTVYTSRSAFLSAAGPVTTIDFNGTSGASQLDFYRNQTWTLSGVTFAAATFTDIFSVGVNDPFEAGAAYGSDYLEWQDSANPLTITLPEPVTAVGFDYMELRGHDDTFTINIANSVAYAGSGMVPSFFGVITAVPFQTFTITDWGSSYTDYATLDNLTFSGASTAETQPVPEPASLALFGAALLGVVALHRRLQRNCALNRCTAPPAAA